MRWLVIWLTLWASVARAHEFWIEPQAFELAPDAPLVADIRVGDKLSGSAFSFVPPNFRRFDVVINGEVVPVEGRAGDRPALNMVMERDGLATIVHVTRDYLLTYKDRATFERFCAHKDVVWACEAHDGRGLDPDKVRERYSRHAKSLVALGDGAGQDVAVGLRTEIVAEANPFTDDLTAGMPLRVLYDGAPRGDAQLELFERAPDGAVTVQLFRTDAEGRVRVPVRPGHFYLADAVAMFALDPEPPSGPAWETLWASLTFQVPN